jgi:hypothetical protein
MSTEREMQKVGFSLPEPYYLLFKLSLAALALTASCSALRKGACLINASGRR